MVERKFNKLSVVIPVKNEAGTIAEIIQRVEDAELGIELEFVIVNDGSTDQTSEILQSFVSDNRFKILTNPQSTGKSRAVKAGLLQTTGDLVVIQDADLEYDPQDLKQFIHLFQTTDVNVLYGNRFGLSNEVIYWQNWIGNRGLSLVSSLLTWASGRMWTNDMEVCYKMAEGDLFRQIASTLVSSSKFGLEPELTAKFAKSRINGHKIKFAEIPVHYYPRSISQGKHMRPLRDGLQALFEIIRFNLAK